MQNITQYSFFDELKALPFIDSIWLYGSRARGDHHARSDFDIAIICPIATRHDWLRVLDIVEKADTLLKIDVVRFDSLKEDDPLAKSILKDKKILFKRETNHE